jgi:hypothetical protein
VNRWARGCDYSTRSERQASEHYDASKQRPVQQRIGHSDCHSRQPCSIPLVGAHYQPLRNAKPNPSLDGEVQRLSGYREL